ncbi:MAG: hypothetical protein NDF55_10195 [archaeon GB-1867-005]|nr:hypothetical protein [Candidatus Culexmicrobium cathedralense]
MTDGSDRISAIDFIINVLREHEKTLDSLIERLDDVSRNLLETSTSEKYKNSQIVQGRYSNLYVLCESWEEFKRLCKDVKILSFQIDNELRIIASNGNMTCEYREVIPRYIEKSLKCGMPIRFQLQPDPEKIRKFLQEELNISSEKIIHGKIQFSP